MFLNKSLNESSDGDNVERNKKRAIFHNELSVLSLI